MTILLAYKGVMPTPGMIEVNMPPAPTKKDDMHRD